MSVKPDTYNAAADLFMCSHTPDALRSSLDSDGPEESIGRVKKGDRPSASCMDEAKPRERAT